MNIVLRELRANRKSLIIWCVSMSLLIFISLVKYSGIAMLGQSANDLFNQLPDAMKSIFGLNFLDLTKISGYYGVLFPYLMLLGSTHAVFLGATIISKEESDKTADFLLVKPISRSTVITAKLIAALINLVLLNMVTLISSIFFVAMYNQGAPINAQISRLIIALFILQVIFSSVGAGISGIAKNTKKATSFASTVLLTTFVLSVASDLYSKIDFLRYFTPFKYFPTVQVMQGSYEPLSLFLSLLIIITSTVLTYRLYEKQDIQI